MELNVIQLLGFEIACIIFSFILLYKCFYLKKGNMDFFLRFIEVLCVFVLLNLPIRMIEMHLVKWNRELVYVLYSLSVIIMTFTMFYWFLFVLRQIDSFLVSTKVRAHLSVIPALLTIPLCIINRRTGWLFYIDNNSWYHRGSIFVLQAIVSYGYLILLLIANTRAFFRAKEKAAAKKFFLSIIPALIFIVMQILFGGSFLVFGTLMSGLIMYIEICMDRLRLLELNKVIDNYTDENEQMRELFRETAASLSGAIDAKDKYTQGHSQRVADYSMTLAKMMGLSDEQQKEVYFAALLHDVGKIGVKDDIINKEGKLTPEEYSEIKKHTTMGYEILKKISRWQYLNVGAHYHHERYDGKGYPMGLKGDDIPIIARIISVADAYDAMTSKRSYRDVIPQQHVREQIVMGAGTQFDPVVASHMISLIDKDFEYSMREMRDSSKPETKTSFVFKEMYGDFTEEQWIISFPTHISVKAKRHQKDLDVFSMPVLVIYDALDSKVHTDAYSKQEMNYTEFLSIRADGVVEKGDIRRLDIRENVITSSKITKTFDEAQDDWIQIDYVLEKFKDHIRIHMNNGFKEYEYIVALKDSIRYAYGAITGANCELEVLAVSKSEKQIGPTDIPRIAEMISFLDGPEGDIPNVQVDAWRITHSEEMEISEGRYELSFHSMSLPTARLIWHCPFLVLFASDNNKIGGENCKEHALIRMDGESFSDIGTPNKHFVNTTEDFDCWDTWKANNKKGVDCVVTFERKGREIVTKTRNSGIEITNFTTLPEDNIRINLVLTGDQVALTNIKLKKLD